MDDYILELKNKFGYSGDLVFFLNQLIPYLIEYYGEEYKDTILEALSNCEIHIQSKDEEPKTYLNSYYNVDKEWNIPVMAGALYHNEINISDNQVVSKPIIYIKRVYSGMYIPFNFYDESQMSTLIHEICHLIKGYGKAKMVNGKIVDSTGLMTTTFSYSQDNGVVEEANYMVGIEEALNDMETAQILEMMTDKKQEAKSYKAAANAAARLLEHEDIAKVIRTSQFNGDDTWIKYLGEEQSKILIDSFDTLVNALYVSYSDIDTDEKQAALFQKMEMANATIIQFIETYNHKEDNQTIRM